MLTKVLTRALGGALVIVFATAVNVQVGKFMATYQGVDIRLQWAVADEGGVNSYDLYKKFGEEQSFSKIASVNPAGQRSYIFLDDALFKKENQFQDIHYKLTIKSAQGNTDYFSSVQQSPTAIERTWRSIRSMFK
jgi:hypothetical protein